MSSILKRLIASALRTLLGKGRDFNREMTSEEGTIGRYVKSVRPLPMP